MAALNPPFWHVITPEMRQVLFDINQQSFSHDFYLAGGTALSLQIGHRQSVDLDFFSEIDEVGEHTRKDFFFLQAANLSKDWFDVS